MIHNVQAGYFDRKWDDFFLLFTPFFSTLFRIDFSLRSLDQNKMRVAYIKSYDTQEPSGVVSPNLAVPLVHLDVVEVGGQFLPDIFVYFERNEGISIGLESSPSCF